MIDHYKTYLEARMMVEHLLFAVAAKPEEYARTYHETRAVEALNRAAEQLGYDLLKREPKQEAA